MTEPEVEFSNKNGLGDERPIEIANINENGVEAVNIYDLNNMFNINYDVLKNIIDALAKNQRVKDEKIANLENQVLDLKILIGDSMGDPEFSKKLQGAGPRIPHPRLKLGDFPNTKSLKTNIRAPPNDIKLDVSISNDDVINNIIVRNFLFIILF